PHRGRGNGNPAGPPPPSQTHRCSTGLVGCSAGAGSSNASLRRRGERSRDLGCSCSTPRFGIRKQDHGEAKS
ncbi:unnamed protein product, partial [Musa hybrid cultivar]